MKIQLPSHEQIKETFLQGEEAVVALFDKLETELIELAEQLQKQGDVIQELQARLAKNSKNSSKPPSSDGYAKENRTTSLRQKGNKPNGGHRVIKVKL